MKRVQSKTTKAPIGGLQDGDPHFDGNRLVIAAALTFAYCGFVATCLHTLLKY